MDLVKELRKYRHFYVMNRNKGEKKGELNKGNFSTSLSIIPDAYCINTFTLISGQL